MKKERITCILMLMIALILSISSCSKDDDNELETPTNKEENYNSTPKDNDNYYVKYEVLNGVQISYASKTERTVRCKDVVKEVTVQVAHVPWEATYGPFKKGDKVYMMLTSAMGKFNSICRLSVSKNKEAFAIKDELNYVENGKLEYTIGY
ncbi:MAG: hypothetical protein IKD78_09510 [Bacteroidales bacterium]|nr:hypothetical protein [Bacteroidales bacterium]